MLNSIIKASIRMSGISLIQLITFLCLIVPSFVFSEPSPESGESEHKREVAQFIFIWKVSLPFLNQKYFVHFYNYFLVNDVDIFN